MITLEFDGYWKNVHDLPEYSEIYTVRAVKVVNNSIISSRILYIGKADNIKERHCRGHEHFSDFVNHLSMGETLEFTAAPVDGRQLSKVENALVYMQQPPVNTDLKDSYNHGADAFKIYGVGADDFRYTQFGFLRANDCKSFYHSKDEEE